MKAAQEGNTVAPGVTREDCPLGNSYRLHGGKDALIASGLVKPEWFPDGPWGKRSKKIRHRHTDEDGRRILCREDSPGRFYVSIDDYGEGREGSKSESPVHQERLTLAPPVESGSLTEAEKHHLRILRTLSPDGKDSILDFAEHFLLRADSERKYRAARRQQTRLHLKLVVDNQTAV